MSVLIESMIYLTIYDIINFVFNTVQKLIKLSSDLNIIQLHRKS